MKNVAIINTTIFGSTGKIASGLASYLKNKGYNSYFCFGRGHKTDVPFYKIGTKISSYFHAFLTRVFGLEGFGSILATKRLVRFLKKNSIDTVYLISLHGYYVNERILFDYISKNNVKTVYIMVDEYAFLGKCPYNNGCNGYMSGCKKCEHKKDYPKSLLFDGASRVYLMKKANYSSVRDITFVGPEFVVKKAITSPLLESKKIRIVDEAIDTGFYHPRDARRLRSELGIDDKKIVCVCVAPYSYERKGCKYFIDLAKRFEGNDKYTFVHVGFDAKNGNVELPRNYIPIGFIRDQELLSQYYSLGDLFVFPSLQDTMPNACLEALACGTPLLMFNVSGMPYIADDTVSFLVEPKNVDQMERVVKRLDKKDAETIKRCREYSLVRYDRNNYYHRLIAIGEEQNDSI